MTPQIMKPVLKPSSGDAVVSTTAPAQADAAIAKTGSTGSDAGPGGVVRTVLKDMPVAVLVPENGG
jgi:hypothetical protein